MRGRGICFILGLMLLTAASVRADKIRTDHDRTVDFSKFRTFMWQQEPQTDNPFMKDRIMDAVNAQLTSRGLKLVNDGADLVVGAEMATDQKHEWNTYYNGDPWWGWSGWSTTMETTYDVGTLTVNLFEADTHELVWQGVGTDVVSDKPAKRTKENNKQIDKMFREFPPIQIRYR